MRPARQDSRYGDPSVIRGHARALRYRAADLRREGDRLVGLADATSWTGRAAEAMRRRARDRAAALRRTAVLHERAADALDRHASEVERRLEEIADVERRVRGLVEAARERLGGPADRLADGVRALVADPVDLLLDRFGPPPPGHRDWLDVDLPGARR